MRRLLTALTALLIFSNTSYAQIIQGFDTVCVDNPLQLSTTVTGASSYYWGFCSAYLNNTPQGSSIAAGTGLDEPSSIALVDDSVNKFIFCLNEGGSNDLIRYEFGTSLANAPAATNLGDFGGIISSRPRGFWFVQQGDDWFGFATAGPIANSQIIRFEFGNSLTNVPVVTDLGNLGGQVFGPQDIYVFEEAGNWHAITMSFNGVLYQLDFGTSLTNVPTVNNFGNPGFALSFPTGFWPSFDGTDWYLFTVNAATSSIVRLDYGPSLLNPTPVPTNLGNFGGIFDEPRDISMIRDCDNWYGYVTNQNGDKIVQLTFEGSLTNVPVETDLGNFAGLDGPRYITNFLRSRDNVFAFTANNDGNSLSRLEYNSCLVPNVLSSTSQMPPAVTYPTPGQYNVFFVADEGLPTMQIECKLITIIPIPETFLQADTLICLGDTVRITGNGIGLTGIQWDPIYNMLPPTGDTETVTIFPRETITYNVTFEYASGGCIYDSAVTVTVGQVIADAGEDRFVADGAYTTLGGPKMSYGPEFSYKWKPTTYLDLSTSANPRVEPLDEQFYILEVTNDSNGCKDLDSVYVFSSCTDLHLPNAFNPVSDIQYNRFYGLMNKNISTLNYFRIYNRWGNLVFETTDPNIQWDGNHNNIPAPSDNYVWMVDGECSNGIRVQKQGTVLLIR